MNDISEGIVLFNNENFFEAHDYFEALWIKADKEERLFYQGLVQMSVGCFHLICGNYSGALSQFNRGTDKLNQYVPEYYGVNLEKLLKEINYLIESIIIFNAEKTPIDLTKIPKIEYNQIA